MEIIWESEPGAAEKIAKRFLGIDDITEPAPDTPKTHEDAQAAKTMSNRHKSSQKHRNPH